MADAQRAADVLAVHDDLADHRLDRPRRMGGGGELLPEPRQRVRPEPPRSAATSFPCRALKRNPDPANLPKNVGGVIFAVAVMCASTSRTVQSAHRDLVDHCASDSGSMSASSAWRSAWMMGHGFAGISSPGCEPLQL